MYCGLFETKWAGERARSARAGVGVLLFSKSKVQLDCAAPSPSSLAGSSRDHGATLAPPVF